MPKICPGKVELRGYILPKSLSYIEMNRNKDECRAFVKPRFKKECCYPMPFKIAQEMWSDTVKAV